MKRPVRLSRFIFFLGLVVFFFSTAFPAHADTVFSEDFESGGEGWTIDNGVWEVGTPIAGPSACYSGTQCAGTNLDSVHPGSTDSSLISGSFELPTVSGAEEIHLRFWTWFSYSTWDSGQVRVRIWDVVTSSWGAWVDVGTVVVNTSDWSLKDVELTAYAGKTIQLTFSHTVQCYYGSCSDTSYGWYIDDIGIKTTTTATNHPPELSPLNDVAVNENDTLTIPLVATDPNLADTLILEIVTGPSFVSFNDKGDGTGELVAAPGFDDGRDATGTGRTAAVDRIADYRGVRHLAHRHHGAYRGWRGDRVRQTRCGHHELLSGRAPAA